MAGLRGVLQAGGRGLRMGRGDVPKPLLPVGGVPMAERLLRRMIAGGVRRLTLITGWQAERVEEHFSGLSDLPRDVEIEFLRETRPRGNVGALHELARADAAALLSFADLVTDLDFRRLIELHRSRGCAATLTSHFESYRVRLGEIETSGDDVVSYREKPEKRFRICSGIAVFEPVVLRLIPADTPFGISDLVSAALDGGLKVTHWEHGAFWMDVNSPDELEHANVEVRKRGGGR